ncbi:MAG TPA: iron-containing alcohol dehydrogenase [Gemmataceae bacterium]|jgi:alcohol dehydrogenase class IV|nr:iron-containing alcohol dehydrogenase [Gemmataceae bacterium]
MRETWTFHSAGQLVFGRNAVLQLGEVAKRLRLKRILIVTDKVLERTGLVDKVRRPLTEAGLTVDTFDGGEPEPSFRAAAACLDWAKSFAPDGLLGLGGGSNMDLAKIAATVLAHGGEPRTYIGDDQIPGPILPLICVPTTAGTGSEVTAASVLTDHVSKMKVGILSNFLRPSVAVVDPLMTISCPPQLSADSGIDALSHAIEAYTAVDNEDFPLPPGERSVYQGRHPMGNCMAEKAMQLIGANLEPVVRDGQNLEARDAMALGATMAGLAFSNVGVALIHAMEYPVGGAVHCSHGTGNGLLLPHVMRFHLEVRTPEFARIAGFLGEKTAGLSEAAAAERAVVAVDRLRANIGVPARLRDLGVTQEMLPAFAEKAASIRRILRVNPREVTPADVLGIYQAAW